MYLCKKSIHSHCLISCKTPTKLNCQQNYNVTNQLLKIFINMPYNTLRLQPGVTEESGTIAQLTWSNFGRMTILTSQPSTANH